MNGVASAASLSRPSSARSPTAWPRPAPLRRADVRAAAITAVRRRLCGPQDLAFELGRRPRMAGPSGTRAAGRPAGGRAAGANSRSGAACRCCAGAGYAGLRATAPSHRGRPDLLPRRGLRRGASRGRDGRRRLARLSCNNGSGTSVGTRCSPRSAGRRCASATRG